MQSIQGQLRIIARLNIKEQPEYGFCLYSESNHVQIGSTDLTNVRKKCGGLIPEENVKSCYWIHEI